MRNEKIAIQAILCYLWKKEMNDLVGPGTVNKFMTENWLRCFKIDDTRLEDKLISGRPSVVEDETL